MSQVTKLQKDRNVSMDRVRNIGIIAHINAGKTTTTERILFYTGKIHKIGVIDDGTTTTDTMDQEKEKGITIQSACITTFWKDYRFNIIDTPGHVDFTAEVERSLRVLDGAIMVFDGNAGVQAQSETVWHQADKYKVPRLIFVNKMDKVGADLDMVLKSIQDKLAVPVVTMVIPVGKEHNFTGVIDLLNQKMIIWDKDDQGIEFTVKDVEKKYQSITKSARAEMIEKIASEDDVLMEKFLNEEDIEVKDLKKALRSAVIKSRLFPVYCGSAWRNKGVQPVLDAVTDYLPSPLDLKPIEGFDPVTNETLTRKHDKEEPLSALLFKVQSDPHVGTLSYIRVYSGTLNAGSQVYNVTKKKNERLGRLLLMHADKREGIEQGFSGEIVAAIGLKDSTTGDTLCDKTHPISLTPIQFSDPVISLAIEPQTTADQEKMGTALSKLTSEDPTFKVSYDNETGQTIIAGMGELYLEIIVDRLKREFNVSVKTGTPQVAYRETISISSEGEGKYIHQSGGHGQYGHCKKTLQKGILAGYPITDIQITLYDGSYHEVDSSDNAFKLAAAIAIKDAFTRAKPILLEPIMKMEINTPSDFLGTVIGDLSSRRGQINSTVESGKSATILASIPLEAVRGYATVIRSLTQGRGSFYMEPSHYEPVPSAIQQKITSDDSSSSKG